VSAMMLRGNCSRRIPALSSGANIDVGARRAGEVTHTVGVGGVVPSSTPARQLLRAPVSSVELVVVEQVRLVEQVLQVQLAELAQLPV